MPFHLLLLCKLLLPNRASLLLTHSWIILIFLAVLHFHIFANHSPLWFPHVVVSFSSVQSLSRVRLFATPWITARQDSLSITNSWSSLRLKSIESVMPSSHLILCQPLLPLPPIPPSIEVFSNESTLRMRWSKYWSFSLSISSWVQMAMKTSCKS